MMPVILQRMALIELVRARDYYNRERPRLGFEFVDEINEAIARARAAPKRYPLIERGYRRVLTRRFPYAIWYREDLDALRIIAISHQKRRPYYWSRRKF